MIQLAHETIDLHAVLASVADDYCGASVLFTGNTRRWTKEVYTDKLTYEAHEAMAIAQLEKIVATAKARWDIRHVCIVHRLGEVPVGQVSVAVAVSSPHRSESFEAAKWLIDSLKQDVPIWKCEFDENGQSSWVHPQADRAP